MAESMISKHLVSHNSLLQNSQVKNNINDLSLHPIILSIGTYSYNLAKFLSSLLEAVVSTTHCTKDYLASVRKSKGKGQ